MRQAVAVNTPPTGFARRGPTLPDTVQAIAADHLNEAVFCATAGIVGFGYSLLLPFEFTQRLTLANWHYLDGRLKAFGVAVAWIVTAQVHAVRQVIRRRGSSAGAFRAVVGVLPSLLCRTPIIPTALGTIGLSGVSLAHTSGRIQYFFASNQNAILAASLALVVAAAIWATHRAGHADCLHTDNCPAGSTSGHDNKGHAVGPSSWRAPEPMASALPSRTDP